MNSDSIIVTEYFIKVSKCYMEQQIQPEEKTGIKDHLTFDDYKKV